MARAMTGLARGGEDQGDAYCQGYGGDGQGGLATAGGDVAAGDYDLEQVKAPEWCDMGENGS